MINEELNNNKSHKEIYLDKKKIQEDNAKMIEIVMFNRIGNNKTKVWRPSK